MKAEDALARVGGRIARRDGSALWGDAAEERKRSAS
jgi:hypothetical protein